MDKHVTGVKSEFHKQVNVAEAVADANVPGVTVRSGNNRSRMLVEADPVAIQQLKEKLGDRFIVEPEILHHTATAPERTATTSGVTFYGGRDDTPSRAPAPVALRPKPRFKFDIA